LLVLVETGLRLLQVLEEKVAKEVGLELLPARALLVSAPLTRLLLLLFIIFLRVLVLCVGKLVSIIDTVSFFTTLCVGKLERCHLLLLLLHFTTRLFFCRFFRASCFWAGFEALLSPFARRLPSVAISAVCCWFSPLFKCCCYS